MKKQCSVVTINSGLGGHHKGAHLGPAALEVESLNKHSSIFSNVFAYNVPQNYSTENTVPYLKNITILFPFYTKIVNTLPAIFKKHEKNIILSGDHSNAIATITALQKTYPNKTIGIIWIDAHLDLHNPYTTPSGNIHGMSLGQFFNHQKKPNKLHTQTLKYWSQIQNLAGKKIKKIEEKHLAFFGVRSLEEEENNILNQFKVMDIMIKDLRSAPLTQLITKLKEQFAECDMCYVSFDVDVIDPNFSKGTGTPVANGLTLIEARDLVLEIIKKMPVKVFEITEINPLLDCENKMAHNVFPILNNVYKHFTK